jgi:hypothetical protein
MVSGAVALLALLLLCYPTDRRQIKRQFKRVAQWVSKEGPEGPLAIVQSIPEGRKYFADPCELKAEAYGVDESFSPLELSKLAMGARSRFDSFSVEFYDLTVGFTGDGEARATVTARISGSGGEDRLQETREVDCVLRKVEGRWLFSRIALVQVLKK